MGKDVVSRAWQKTCRRGRPGRKRGLAGDDIVRLTLDGTLVKVRLDRKAMAISRPIRLGVCRATARRRRLAIKNMGGESEAAWRACWTNLTSARWARVNLTW